MVRQKSAGQNQVAGHSSGAGLRRRHQHEHAVGADARRCVVETPAGEHCANIFRSRVTWKCRSLRNRRNIISARRGISATLRFPTNWSGTHFTLFLERVHWKTTVWLDDKEIGSDDQPRHAACITDLGMLTPGKHRLTIRVDNRMQLPAAGHWWIRTASLIRSARRGTASSEKSNCAPRAGVD